MLGKEVIAHVMKERGFSAAVLAEKLGYATPSGVTERLRGKQDIRTDNLAKFLEAMDCELIVRSKIGKKETWAIDGKATSKKTEEGDDK